MAGSDWNKETERMHRLQNAFNELAEPCMIDLVNFLYSESKSNTPVDTGFLRNSWSMLLMKKDGDRYSGGVYNPTEYGPHVNYGHRIKLPIKKNGAVIGHKYAGFVSGQYFQERAREAYKKVRKRRLQQLQKDIVRRVDG